MHPPPGHPETTSGAAGISEPAGDSGTVRPTSFANKPTQRRRAILGLTLVEVMVSMTILTTIMMGFLSSFIQSRRITENSVMHAAVTSLVYGIIEQIKGLDYTTLIPSPDIDTLAPTGSAPPYIRIRINQDQTAWLQVKYTPAGTTPQAPTTTPDPTVTAASLGLGSGSTARVNTIGPLPLSSVSGAHSQALTLVVWIWVDEMPDVARDVVQVKRITIVYTYTYNDGFRTRTVRDREVFIRTRFDM